MKSIALVLLAGSLLAGPNPRLEPEAVLPPSPFWDGASRILLAGAGDPWITPAEQAGFRETPSYEETLQWLRRLEAATPQMRLVSLGRSDEGRELWMAVVSREGGATPEELRATGKPTLFAQGGIHSGEIDGKDAGLMLLRDLTVGAKLDLLDRCNLLFLPIFNVDGHERSSRWSRMNQRGPGEKGWRTTARNLNLNRDYSKLDTPVMRALVAAIVQWQPDLYLDLHVTDGADYQYDITFGWNAGHGHSPEVSDWLDRELRPALDRGLRQAGHVPGPLIFLVDSSDLSQGIYGWTASPRYSNGWGDARHLPTVLVENHSLKPYEQRVLGTYVLLRDTLETLGREYPSLREAVRQDRERSLERVPLSWAVPEGESPTVLFHPIESRLELSPVSGATRIRWTGKPLPAVSVPHLLASEPDVSVIAPPAYWIPPPWNHVAGRLEAQGIRVERTEKATELEVELYRLHDPQFDDVPFEGRLRVQATPEPERRRESYPAGSIRVPTDQPLGRLVVLLLEPASPDSFFQWGFFHEVLQRTEYFESYVMEAIAEEMLAEDPALAESFRLALEGDPELRGDPRERLQWFYERTPYYDERYLLYPVARELPPDPKR